MLSYTAEDKQHNYCLQWCSRLQSPSEVQENRWWRHHLLQVAVGSLRATGWTCCTLVTQWASVQGISSSQLSWPVRWKMNARDDTRGWYYMAPERPAATPPEGRIWWANMGNATCFICQRVDLHWPPLIWFSTNRPDPGQWTTEAYSKDDANPAPVVSTYKAGLTTRGAIGFCQFLIHRYPSISMVYHIPRSWLLGWNFTWSLYICFKLSTSFSGFS